MNIAIDARIADLSGRDRALLFDRRPFGEPELAGKVRGLLSEVRTRGDASLLEMAAQFDGIALRTLEVPRERWDVALAALDPSVRAALERAARNIEAFHRAQIPDDVELEVSPGVRLGRRWVPIATAGIYAPGGRAAYPSSVLMGVVPARTAGVGTVVVCSPPGARGEPPPEVLAACAIGGADRLFAIGGVGAIGAMTYGTQSVPRVGVVVGPGNRWVTEAKRQVAGDVVIDSPAGPSEVLVVADESCDPVLAACELVAQAEHDPEASIAIVSPSAALLHRVRQELRLQADEAPRGEVVRAALAARGALLEAEDLEEALAFAEAYAAEHLALLVEDPAAALAGVTTAGTVFLGQSSSVAFGDYMTGANHVLPTAGRARSFSGLSTQHFLRSFTWQELTPAAADGMAEDVACLAEAEGLPAHAVAARARAFRRDEEVE